MQGQLLSENLTVHIATRCQHCSRRLHFEMDRGLRFAVRERAAQPLIFLPDVAWDRFAEPNILHAY